MNLLSRNLNLKGIEDSLSRFLEELQQEEYAPFYINGKSFSLINKLDIKTSFGENIMLYDQLLYSYLWYKSPYVNKRGFVDYIYFTNIMIFKESEISKAANILFTMSNNEQILVPEKRNKATIPIYKNKKHFIDCIHEGYCDFFSHANNPNAMHYLKSIVKH